MINVQALYYFLEICSTHSFALAAERLHLTRPALSIAIKKLESELGFALFDRSHHGATLTIDGEIVAEYAKEVFAALNKIENLSVKNVKPVNLTIYTNIGAGSNQVPYIVSEYQKRYPDGNIATLPMKNLSMEDIFEKNENALILNIFDEDYEFPQSVQHIVLDKCSGTLAMSKQATFLAQEVKSVSFKDIVDLPFLAIANEETQIFYDKMLTAAQKHGELNIDFTAQSINMVLPLLSKQVGVFFYPCFRSLFKLIDLSSFRFVNIKKAPKFILAICYSNKLPTESIDFITNFFNEIYDFVL